MGAQNVIISSTMPIPEIRDYCQQIGVQDLSAVECIWLQGSLPANPPEHSLDNFDKIFLQSAAEFVRQEYLGQILDSTPNPQALLDVFQEKALAYARDHYQRD